MYEERFYRNSAFSKFTIEVSYKESDLLISTAKEIEQEVCHQILKKYYEEIEQYVKKTPAFLTSLSPLEVDNNAPAIVKEMMRVSWITKIGPFSSVAGAIALYVGKEILTYSDEVIIENGGDIFLKINEDKKLGIYLGENSQMQNLSLRIKSRKHPFGIASSSSSFGHSLNFGGAQLVTVIAKDAVIADGFATSLSNRIKKDRDIVEVLEFVKMDPFLEGIFIYFEEKMFLWGALELA